MIIKCLKCGYSKEVDNIEYENMNCVICGEPLYIDKNNIANEIIKKDIDEHLKEYFKEFGIEGTIEFIEKHKEYPLANFYIKRLKELGLLKTW